VPPEPTRLAALAPEAGAQWKDWAAPEARFVVDDDAGATRLLAVLLADGQPVVEAAPEEGRLERLFTGTAPTPEVKP
jgi:hypothetical protein